MVLATLLSVSVACCTIRAHSAGVTGGRVVPPLPRIAAVNASSTTPPNGIHDEEDGVVMVEVELASPLPLLPPLLPLLL